MPISMKSDTQVTDLGPVPNAGGGGIALKEGIVSPDEFDPQPQEPQPRSAVATGPEDTGNNELGLASLGGAAALGAGAYALHNPEMAKTALGKLAKIVGVARMTSMLSGLAPLKSALGNLGAPLIEAAERGTLDPVREFASMQTIKDYINAFKTGDIGTVQGSDRWNIPGRMMGAGDFATQKALQRSGLNNAESAAATLQTPLGVNFGKMGKALDSPIARLTVPFRRTPFNQFYEGFKTMTPSHEHKLVTAGTAAIGAATGAASSDEQYPVAPGLTAAVAGRYGVPAIFGAYLGRQLAKGKGGGGLISSILPVTEYGTEESLSNPLKPIDPAYWGITRAYQRITGAK